MDSISIHPRVASGHAKVNTARPRGPKSKYLDRAQRKLNQRRLAREATVKTLSSSSNPAAYRVPGSMNEHKR